MRRMSSGVLIWRRGTHYMVTGGGGHLEAPGLFVTISATPFGLRKSNRAPGRTANRCLRMAYARIKLTLGFEGFEKLFI